MRGARLRAFAKVNYALEVRGVREDGYHEIASVMQSVSLFDEVEIERSAKGFELLVEPEGTEIGPPEENTIHKAWTLLRELTGEGLPARVRLRKGIPAGAGLGGGSADAAATLVGLNGLFGLGLDAGKLGEVGARIGTDVPFCLLGGTALASGRGDVLAPLPGPPAHHLVVAKPLRGANTARIYRAYDERPRESSGSVGPAVAALRAGDLSALSRAVGNDLDPVTRRFVPEVATIERALPEAGALGASMSGTGTAVYGIFASLWQARAAASGLWTPFVGVCEPVARGVRALDRGGRGPTP